jgi:glycosyltransferase involved in cell wall biosynthesis
VGGLRKITFLGPAYPYRGGIATIIETLARVFRDRGAEVDIKTFSVQYPEWLFPGKSQFRGGEPPEGLRIERCVNTVNPFNWLRVGRRIRREAPDVVVLKYWTPFMAPCFGTIARVAKWGRNRGKRTKFLVQLDNVVPHERRWFDGLLTRYFVRSMDGFVYMSEAVGLELAEFDTTKPRIYSPHPIFDHYGERLSREEAAARLGLDPANEYVLFFGLVRAYKGLDMLLEATARLKASNRKLIIAGEFYDDVEKYRAQIAALGLSEDVIIHDRFIGDDEITLYFSLSDLLVLPYRSATQSGVTQIAYHFDVPMIVTNVGGLPEIVHDGVVGYVCEPTSKSIAAAIEKFYTGDNAANLRANFPEEKKRFSWDAAADALAKLA